LAVALTLEQLEARVAELEARVPSAGRMVLHEGPILPERMPAHVAMDPIGAMRAEISRLRKIEIAPGVPLPMDACWDRLDINLVQTGMALYAKFNGLKTQGFRAFVMSDEPLSVEMTSAPASPPPRPRVKADHELPPDCRPLLRPGQDSGAAMAAANWGNKNV
jgi:hypothetical protein